jgi:dihydrofolate reductase
MRINIVVATSQNWIIGRDGGLPWRLSADLKQFKSVTMGHPLIMGRRTHESIGRVLPGRLNIVVSRQKEFTAPGCKVARSLDMALAIAGQVEEVMVVGGAALYAAALESATRIYLTEVHVDIEGDTVFPAIDWTQWREISRARHGADDRNQFDYSFVIFDRISVLQRSEP